MEVRPAGSLRTLSWLMRGGLPQGSQRAQRSQRLWVELEHVPKGQWRSKLGVGVAIGIGIEGRGMGFGHGKPGTATAGLRN